MVRPAPTGTTPNERRHDGYPPLPECTVIAQTTLTGHHAIKVRRFGRDDGWTQPYISIQVGRLLLNLNDRDAVDSLIAAAEAAAHYGRLTFGPSQRQRPA